MALKFMLTFIVFTITFGLLGISWAYANEEKLLNFAIKAVSITSLGIAISAIFWIWS